MNAPVNTHTEYLRRRTRELRLDRFSLSSLPLDAMNTLEYHVLLALAGGPLYGYAISDAIAADSAGAQAPRAGSLYRVIARLMSARLVIEAEPDESPPPHPGHARRYYALTAAGRRALSAEARRLREVAAIAERRLGALPGRS